MCKTIFIDNEDQPELEELQELVGGSIQLVNLRAPFDNYQMVINEEGRLLELPHNQRASQFFGSPIFGNAILLSGSTILT